MARVFLDANVYFAGCLSPDGASALILQLARRGRIQVVASRLVLREAERNLRRKTTKRTLQAFRAFLNATPVTIVPTPEERVLERYTEAIHPKDVPILAAAVEANVDYLVTLDRRHFLNRAVFSKAVDVKVLTPGDFLNTVVRRQT
jgi:putative PIN family toxin of toxin-antitoxin system